MGINVAADCRVRRFLFSQSWIGLAFHYFEANTCTAKEPHPFPNVE